MTTEHLPECAERRAEWRWSEDCICPALRACEQRVLKEALQDAKARESNGITWAQAYSAALDAAREAAFNTRGWFTDEYPDSDGIALPVALIEDVVNRIDALRNPPSLPPTTGRAHKY